MVGSGFAAPRTAALAFGRSLPPVVGQSPDRAATEAPEFRDLVERELRRRYDDDVLFRGGLGVRTSLDLDLQRAVVAAIRDELSAPDDPQAAVVAIDPRTGDLRAMATRAVTDATRGYRRGGLNLTTDIARPSGSTIKPFTLAAALAAGKSVYDRYYAPRCASIPNPGGNPNPWRPCNAEPSEQGSYSLREAIEHSVNTVYAPLADEVGIANVRSVALAAGWAPAARFGTHKSSALGVDVTPIALTRAYATLVNGGVRQDLRSVVEVRAAGRLIALAPSAPAGAQAVLADIAGQVTDVLAGVVERGTGTAARQPFPVYGKTGTTDDFTNAWFVDCTRELCLGVWMGYDRQYLPSGEPHAMRHVEGVRVVYGGTLPARIFARTWDRYRSTSSGPGG